MNQTAVEWLGKELESYGDPQFCKIEWEQLDSLFEQAKEMEKEQIMDAAKIMLEGKIILFNSTEIGDGRAEQYYNKQFKKH